MLWILKIDQYLPSSWTKSFDFSTFDVSNEDKTYNTMIWNFFNILHTKIQIKGHFLVVVTQTPLHPCFGNFFGVLMVGNNYLGHSKSYGTKNKNHWLLGGFLKVAKQFTFHPRLQELCEGRSETWLRKTTIEVASIGLITESNWATSCEPRHGFA